MNKTNIASFFLALNFFLRIIQEKRAVVSISPWERIMKTAGFEDLIAMNRRFIFNRVADCWYPHRQNRCHGSENFFLRKR